MRDKRFIAEHRGGPLKKEQHYQLIKWACDCAEHVLCLFNIHFLNHLTILLFYPPYCNVGVVRATMNSKVRPFTIIIIYRTFMYIFCYVWKVVFHLRIDVRR